MYLRVKRSHFLGHCISAAGSRPDPKNIEAVAKMKDPTTVKEVSRFMGMCGLYRKHFSSFAKVAAPLTKTQPEPELHSAGRKKANRLSNS